MRFYLFFITVLTLGASCFAAPKYDYKKFWRKETLQSKTVTMTVFTKQSPIKNIDHIATVTVSENNTDTPETVLNLLKKSLGSEKWAADKIDGLDIYEKFDVQSMTLFRLAYNGKTKQFSMASVKTRFLIPSYVELHLLQVESLTYKQSKATASFLYDLLFSKAMAGDIANQVKNYLTDMGQEIFVPTNKSINGVSASIESSGEKVSDSIIKTGDKTSASIDRASGSLERAADKIDTGVNKVTNTISKKNVAALASIATLSSSVTATLYTLFSSAAYTAARKLYYEAIGEFTAEEKRAKIEGFELAMKNFAELSPQIEEIDQKLTLLSANMKALTGEPTEVTLAKLDADIAAQKARLTQGTSGCAECLEKEVLLKVKELEYSKEIAKAAGIDTEKKKGQICSEVDQMYSAWTDAELKVSLARKSIIQDARVFMGLVNNTAKVELSMQEQRKQNNACLDGVKSEISRISSADVAACDQDPFSARAVCRSLRANRLNLQSCEMAGQALVTDDLKATLAEASSLVNSKIANLSAQVSKLDCDENAKDGACLKPGVFTQVSTSFMQKFSGFAEQCPNRIFSKALPSAKGLAEKKAAESMSLAAPTQAAPAKEESKSFFSKIFGVFKSNKDTTKKATQGEIEMYSGG